jgi:hypothetical protein
MRAGEHLYVEKITDDFLAARGTAPVMVPMAKIDMFSVGCFSIAGQQSDYMIELIKKAMKEGSLVVFLFHGVGGEHGLNVELEEHRKLISFLKENQKEIWVTTFLDAMKFLKSPGH